MRKLLLVAGCWLLVAGSVFGQANYYSKSAGNLNNLGTWGINTDGSGAAPGSFGNANQIFNIRNNAFPTINANWTVSGAGSRVILGDGSNPCTFTVPANYVFTSTCTISDNGTLRITSTAGTPYSGTLTVNSGGTYNHARNGGPIPTATWDPNSNCNITGITNSTGFTGGLEGQVFGNFTWDCPGQNTNPGFFLAANFTVAGNFTVSNTGDYGSSTRVLRMSNNSTGYTIIVNGNFVIGNNSTFKMNNGSGSCTLTVGGNFTINNGGYFTIVTGNTNSTVTVSGDVNILGGTLDMQEDPSASVGTLNVGGNFALAGTGIIQKSSGGSGVINFNGSTIQTYSRTGGTISNNTINFNVLGGSILDVGTSLIDGSTGTFTLNAGAGIITSNAQGISTSGGTGSIRVTGTRTYNAGADYTYNGSVAQVTGSGLVTAHNLTINNSSNVTLSNGVTVNGVLYLTVGKLDVGSNNLIISNTGSISGADATDYVIAESSGLLKQYVNTTDKLFPVGTSTSYLPVTLNNTGGTADYYSVNLFNSVTENGLLGGTQVSDYDEYVKYTWRVIEDVATGSNLAVTVQWNASDEGATFDRTDCSLGFHNGTVWLGEAPAAASGLGPYTKIRTGITSTGILSGSFAVGKRCTRVGDITPPAFVSFPADVSVECDAVFLPSSDNRYGCHCHG